MKSGGMRGETLEGTRSCSLQQSHLDGDLSPVARLAHMSEPQYRVSNREQVAHLRIQRAFQEQPRLGIRPLARASHGLFQLTPAAHVIESQPTRADPAAP
jgi:hypothetical protein